MSCQESSIVVLVILCIVIVAASMTHWLDWIKPLDRLKVAEDAGVR